LDRRTGLDFLSSPLKLVGQEAVAGNTMRIGVALALSGILLAGCASSSSTMITEDTALITVVGQSASDGTKVVDRTIAEAARVTREHGYRYFVILDATDASQKGTRILLGETIYRRNTSQKGAASFPGPTYYHTLEQRVPYVRLGLDVTIRMYREGDVDPKSQGVWNTDVILGGMAGDTR
jgi:hypothetical protein